MKPSRRDRSFSLLDEFRTDADAENDENAMLDDVKRDEREDEEMRRMILNQSGLSQQWQQIEKRNKQKRKQAAKKSTRRRKKKKKDGEYLNVRRPQMSEVCDRLAVSGRVDEIAQQNK